MKVGIDIVQVNRFADMVNNPKHLSKIFTEYEVKYINQTTNMIERVAGLYAVKEAVVKALGIGLGRGIDLIDIEVNHDDFGKPHLVVNDKLRGAFNYASVINSDISISHTNENAIAICILF